MHVCVLAHADTRKVRTFLDILDIFGHFCFMVQTVFKVQVRVRLLVEVQVKVPGLQKL